MKFIRVQPANSTEKDDVVTINTANIIAFWIDETLIRKKNCLLLDLVSNSEHRDPRIFIECDEETFIAALSEPTPYTDISTPLLREKLLSALR